MRPVLPRRAPVPLALALALAACGGDPHTPQPCPCLDLPRGAVDLVPAQHVFVVVVDGLSPELITPDDAPNLHRMASEGVRTFDARGVLPSLTLPNSTSIVTGLTPDEHGVRWNTLRPDRGHVRVPTIFDAVHRAGLESALFAGKDKLWHLARPGAADRDTAVERSDAEVIDEALDYLETHRPSLVFIHLPDVDRAGHRFGWLSVEQRRAVRRADAAIGLLLFTLDELDLTKSSLVIATADHGGHGFHHKLQQPPDTRIPWIAWGPGLAARETGPLCTVATAPTVLGALGLPTTPAPAGGPATSP